MRCLLVLPPWSLCDTHSEAMRHTVAGVWPPLGPLYVASVLRQAGHTVQFLDGTLLPLEPMLARIKDFRPDFVGISSVILIWKKAVELVRRIKEMLPETFVAAGAHGPTFLREESFEDCPELDCVVIGEGEYTAREIVSRLESGPIKEPIDGAIIKSNGNLLVGRPRELIGNLDEVPFPALDLVDDITRYMPPVGHYTRLPIAQMLSSRGCPNNCLYCYKIVGNTLRERSPKNIVDEIEWYTQRFGVREIKFWDDVFTHTKERVLKFCDELLSRDLDVSWYCGSRVDAVDEEMLAAMKRAGCTGILYGCESGSQRILDLLRKNVTLEQIRRAIKLTHRHGIRTFCTFIIGSPTETFEEALQTARFAAELNPTYADFFTCAPFPGTDLWEMVKDSDELSKDYSTWGMHQMPFVPNTMTREQMIAARTAAFRRLYLSPRHILRLLRTFRTKEEWEAFLRGLRGAMRFLFFGHKEYRRQPA